MKQWVLGGTYGTDSLQLQDVPIPHPSDYEVLVKFHAASLNFRDIMIANVRPHSSPNTLGIARIEATKLTSKYRDNIISKLRTELFQGEYSGFVLLCHWSSGY